MGPSKSSICAFSSAKAPVVLRDDVEMGDVIHPLQRIHEGVALRRVEQDGGGAALLRGDEPGGVPFDLARGNGRDQADELPFARGCGERRRVDEAELAECAGFFFGHCAAGQVLARQFRAIVPPAQDGVLGAGPGDRLANAVLLPFRLPRLKTLSSQVECLFLGDFVIGDHNALTSTTVGGVEQIHCIESRSTSRKEIDHQGIRFVVNKESDSVPHSINALWEWEFASREDITKQSRPILRRIMGADFPLTTGHS